MNRRLVVPAHALLEAEQPGRVIGPRPRFGQVGLDGLGAGRDGGTGLHFQKSAMGQRQIDERPPVRRLIRVDVRRIEAGESADAAALGRLRPGRPWVAEHRGVADRARGNGGRAELEDLAAVQRGGRSLASHARPAVRGVTAVQAPAAAAQSAVRGRGAEPPPSFLGARRRNPARAMRMVQVRGGARRPHARRSLSTLSVRPRAPTKQMGRYHRSSASSRRARGPCPRSSGRRGIRWRARRSGSRSESARSCRPCRARAAPSGPGACRRRSPRSTSS